MVGSGGGLASQLKMSSLAFGGAVARVWGAAQAQEARV